MSRLPRSPRSRAPHGAALALTLFLALSGPGPAFAATAAGDPGDIEVGDCFNASTAPKDYQRDKVTQGPLSVDIVPCDQPHQSEAYAVIALPDGPYPGESALLPLAREKCGGKTLSDYVGTDAKLSATLTEYFFGPSADNWKAGDRDLICYLSEPGGKTTGSLRAS
ncbi:putative regulator of septum formation [Streptomyces sp. 3211.6]|uniref:septum formation family protein n=1 Tax=Streptomyces TaxID=1883 RepID=UPI0009A4A5C7|nr:MULTISPECIES: septum formation family protein [Streptomyces]RKT07588.1 putative regulator of septum formation [Streptomyces sp. 3211.6]RPF44791.1 putative regulator of septum formation [Streptomyces sp. Ag109_G2-6]